MKNVHLTNVNDHINPNYIFTELLVNELEHDKTNKITCVLGKNSDQPGHPHGLISLRRVGSLATHKVHSKDILLVLSCSGSVLMDDRERKTARNITGLMVMHWI